VIACEAGTLIAVPVDPAAEVRALLRTFQMQMGVKWRIDADLLRLMNGELTLARYPPTAGQQEALHRALDAARATQ